MGAIADDSVTDGITTGHIGFDDFSYVAVSEWDWSPQLGFDGVECCPETVGFNLLENLFDFVRL